MRFKIPNTDNLYIDDRCILTSDSGECVSPVLDCCGTQAFVNINFRTGVQRVLLQWLYLYARSQTPEFVDINHVQFYLIPQSWSEVAWRVMYTQPYWYDKDHRIVPMCPNVAISCTGEALNVKTGKPLKIWKELYLVLKTYLPMSMKVRQINVHLLVANAWLIEEQGQARPCVNHKDGNKFNPFVNNLEWVSFKENALHARNTGLITSKSCRLRHRDTGEVLEFPSVKEVARFLGKLPDHLYLERVPLNHLFNGVYEMRLIGDTRDWLYLPENQVMNETISQYIYKVYGDGEKVKIFNGTQSFANHYHLFDTQPRKRSAKRCISEFRHLYPDLKLEVIDQWPPKRIQVMDVETGKVYTCDTPKEVHDKFGLTRNVISHALRREGKVPSQGYRLRHETSAPWQRIEVDYSPIAVEVTDKTSNERKEFPSLAAANRETGISQQLLRRMCSRPRESDTYTVKIIEGSETK